VRTLQAMKPPMPDGMTAASEPPVSIRSASPRSMCCAALHKQQALSATLSACGCHYMRKTAENFSSKLAHMHHNKSATMYRHTRGACSCTGACILPGRNS